MRKVTRYIDGLLRDKKPRSFVPTDEESAAIRAAITMRAARPENAIPRSEFVAGLRDRLAEQVERTGEPAPPDDVPVRRRRGLLIGTAAAAVASVFGAGVDRLLGGGGRTTAGGTVRPNDGTWQTIMASADLADGQVAAFDAGAVSGFVMRHGNTLSARSGVCTHQGCRLSLTSGQRRLGCPCHHTFFGLDGNVVTSQLSTPPGRLPSFEVRERNGQVQLYVPPTNA